MQSNSYRGGVLLVTHDEDSSIRLKRLLDESTAVRRVNSVCDAKELVRTIPQWCGFVIDLSRSPKSSLTLLGDLRKNHPDIPAAVLVVNPSHEELNASVAHDALVLSKPFDETAIHPLRRRILSHDRRTSARGRAVRRVARRHELTSREVEVLRLAVEGWTSQRVQDQLGIKDKTYQSHVTRILRKTDAKRLSDLTIRILLEAQGAIADPCAESGVIPRSPMTPMFGIDRREVMKKIS